MLTMQRLARGCLTLCLAASLVLCLAACGMWVRSHRIADEADFSQLSVDAQGVTNRGWFVLSGHGRLVVRRTHYTSNDPSVVRMYARWRNAPQGPPSHWSVTHSRADRRPPYGRGRPAFLGFSFREWGIGWRLGVPYWAPAAAFAVAPARWLLRRLRRRRWARPGLCASCGYDLRASPGRCPECGAPAAGSVDERQDAKAAKE